MELAAAAAAEETSLGFRRSGAENRVAGSELLEAARALGGESIDREAMADGGLRAGEPLREKAHVIVDGERRMDMLERGVEEERG